MSIGYYLADQNGNKYCPNDTVVNTLDECKGLALAAMQAKFGKRRGREKITFSGSTNYAFAPGGCYVSLNTGNMLFNHDEGNLARRRIQVCVTGK